jgi:hypothetical protein
MNLVSNSMWNTIGPIDTTYYYSILTQGDFNDIFNINNCNWFFIEEL